MEPEGGTFPEMPRFGMKLLLPAAFGDAEWYGRGPQENYWDRKTGAAVGRYRSSVMDLYFPYLRPQENGYRTDVRWLALTLRTGVGLLVSGRRLFCFNAGRFDIDDFENEPQKRQRHAVDMQPRDRVSLNIDFKQMGVGGDTSWGARTHEEYTLPYRRYSYSFRLRPYRMGEEDPNALSKQEFASHAWEE
jgi:beta-galactosidase